MSDLPKNEIYVEGDVKIAILRFMVHPVMEALAAQTGGDVVAADDMLDFFGMGMAMIFANDPSVTTPRDIRLKGEEAAKLVATRIRHLRALQQESGQSLFDEIMANPPEDDTTH